MGREPQYGERGGRGGRAWWRRTVRRSARVHGLPCSVDGLAEAQSEVDGIGLGESGGGGASLRVGDGGPSPVGHLPPAAATETPPPPPSSPAPNAAGASAAVGCGAGVGGAGNAAPGMLAQGMRVLFPDAPPTVQEALGRLVETGVWLLFILDIRKQLMAAWRDARRSCVRGAAVIDPLLVFSACCRARSELPCCRVHPPGVVYGAHRHGKQFCCRITPQWRTSPASWRTWFVEHHIGSQFLQCCALQRVEHTSQGFQRGALHDRVSSPPGAHRYCCGVACLLSIPPRVAEGVWYANSPHTCAAGSTVSWGPLPPM